MALKDWLSALIVVFIWGTNFIAMKIGLQTLSPMLLGAARFTLVAFPLVFFIPRPPVPWKWLIIYGLTIGFTQFGLLFTALQVGMPAGLASLVLQSQALFTVLLGFLLMQERLRWFNIAALLLAAIGLASLAFARDHGSMTWLGFVLTLCAGLSWACGNLTIKKIGQVDPLALVVWGGLVPIIPYLGLALFIDGPTQILQEISHSTMPTLWSILYIALASSLIGYVLWGRLMSKYPASQVAPLTLIVPFIGISSAWLMLGESINLYQALGGLIVIMALMLNVLGAKLSPWLYRNKIKHSHH